MREDLCWHLEHDVSLERFERWSRDVGIRDEDLDRDIEISRQIEAERLRARVRETKEFSIREVAKYRANSERAGCAWFIATAIAFAVGAAALTGLILSMLR